MSPTQKTTVYLDTADYKRLKAIARDVKRPPAALIREAVTEFTRRHSKRRLPRSIGMAKSGEGDLSGRVEELLEGLGSE
jgi:predicted transcriptional regulator